MTRPEIESFIREACEEDGASIEVLDIQQDEDAFRFDMKAEGNPFEQDELDEVIPLSGRECKYRSIRHGETTAPGGRMVVWYSQVEAWDEYTDAPDTHWVDGWICDPADAQRARTRRQDEIDQLLVGEIAGDLYGICGRTALISRNVTRDQRRRLLDSLAEITRRIACS